MTGSLFLTKRATISVVLSLALIANGCTDQSTEPGRAIGGRPSSQRLPNLKTKPASLRGAYAEYFRIASETPGFGGIIIDSSETSATLLLSRKDNEQAVRARVAEYVGRRRAAMDVRNRRGIPELAIKHVDYDFVDLATYLEAVEKVVGDADVLSWGISERRNKVAIGVRSMSAVPRIAARIDSLGVPQNAVYFEESSGAVTTAVLTDRFDRMIGGIVTGRNGASCTLGFNAYDASGNRLGITASHCTVTAAAPDPNTVFYQPVYNPFLPRRIGTEFIDPVGTPCPANVTTQPGYTCRWSDAAAIKYDNGIDMRFSYIATTSTGNSYTDARPIVGRNMTPVITGQALERLGAMTGRVSGIVDSPCVNAKERDHAGNDLHVIVVCAKKVTGGAQGGDSGGPVYIASPIIVLPPGYATLEGIEFGAETVSGSYFYYSDLDAIEADLGFLNVYGVTTRITGPAWVNQPGTYNWFANARGTRDSLGSYTYAWEKSYNNSTWSSAGIGTDTYTETWLSLGGLNFDFWLRVTVTGGSQLGQVARSEVFKVHVQK